MGSRVALEYPQCKFIRDANVAVANLPHINTEQELTQANVELLRKEDIKLAPGIC